MYTAVPPGRRLDSSFEVTATAHRRFVERSRRYDASTRNYLESAIPAGGVRLDAHELDHGVGNGFREMAAAVLQDVLESRSPDLLVLAHVVPDFGLNDVAAIDVGASIGGIQASFGISDRGALAPFTALTTAMTFATRQGFERVAIVALDQGSLPYSTHRSPTQELHGDAAVALLLERSQRPGVRLAGRSGLEPTEAVLSRSLDEVVAQLLEPVEGISEGEPLRLVVGPGVPPAWSEPWIGRAKVDRAGLGFPCTGVWARWVADGPLATGLTLVVEADPKLGAVHAALLSASGSEADR